MFFVGGLGQPVIILDPSTLFLLMCFVFSIGLIVYISNKKPSVHSSVKYNEEKNKLEPVVLSQASNQSSLVKLLEETTFMPSTKVKEIKPFITAWDRK